MLCVDYGINTRERSNGPSNCPSLTSDWLKKEVGGSLAN